MSKVKKEAELYKNLPPKKLKRVIRSYKGLLFSSSQTFNFLVSFFTFLIFYFLFCKINILTVLLFIIIHYFVIWKYFIEGKRLYLVDPKDADDIKEIIEILESYLKEKPLE
jgi:predicted membrane protein